MLYRVLVQLTSKNKFFIGDHKLNLFQPPAVNFINVKRTNFLYEHHILAAFSSYMYIEKQGSFEKFVHKMLMKLTPAKLIFACPWSGLEFLV